MKKLLLLLAVFFYLAASAQPIYVKVLDQKTGIESWLPYVYSTTITATGVSQVYVDSTEQILQIQIDNLQTQINNLKKVTPPIPTPVITDYILDRFPNNTLSKTETGQSWIINQGSFSVVSSKLSGATKGLNITTIQSSEPLTISVDFNISATSVLSHGIVVRYVDKDNYYLVKNNQDGNGFRIYERKNGVDNLLTFSGSASLSGNLNVVVNNNKIIATIGSASLQADAIDFTQSKNYGLLEEGTGNTFANFLLWNSTGAQPVTPLSAFVLEYPAAYQVYQRNSGIGTIKIKGKIATQPSPVIIEARFNNGTWNSIADNITDNFSGELDNQPQGQGNLDLRIIGTSTTATIPFVGIGDNYIVYGQSNAVGEGDNLQSYSHPTLKAGLFGNDYHWKELTDPFDSPVGQVDIVSRDPSPQGSYWLPLATKLLTQNLPVSFIPCCLGGSPISSFLPTSDHNDRNTLYGSMITRAKSVFGVKAILFHQGESDAITNNTNYKKSLEVMADAIFSDLGVKTYVAKIHWWDEVPTVTVAQVEAINDQIALAATEDSNILLGPDFHKPTDVTHRLHFDSNAALLDAAGRWFNILTNPTK
jgi:hypothetical protein